MNCISCSRPLGKRAIAKGLGQCYQCQIGETKRSINCDRCNKTMVCTEASLDFQTGHCYECRMELFGFEIPVDTNWPFQRHNETKDRHIVNPLGLDLFERTMFDMYYPIDID